MSELSLSQGSGKTCQEMPITKESILADIEAIGDPLFSNPSQNSKRMYNVLAERLVRARSEQPELFSNALDEVHPKVATAIRYIVCDI